MARYMIAISQPADAYLHTLDLMRKESPALLERVYWGFMDGDFSGWLLVESDSEEEARHMLPIGLQSEAHIAEVHRYPPSEIKHLHTQLAAT